MALRLFLSLIAGIAVLAVVAPAQAQGVPLAVELTGTAHGRATVGTAGLTIELEGLGPGAEYVAHVHAGTPQRPAGSVGTLGRFMADARGRGRLQSATATIGNGAQIELSPEWLADGARFLGVHAGDGAVVASGAIPAVAAAEPRELPGAAVLVISLSVGATLLVIWAAMRLSPVRVGGSF